MRTPNTKCEICEKPLYRRPSDLKKFRGVCCVGCRSAYYKSKPVSPNLELGRQKGIDRKGHIQTPEEKAKRSKTLRQFYIDNPEVAQERGKKLRAELHYRWNGGISKLNKSIRTMTENRKWMETVKKRDGKCLFCGSKKELEADHIKPLAEILTEYEITDREQARECKELWDLDNGRTLCRKCHSEKDNRKYTPIGQGRRQRVYSI